MLGNNVEFQTPNAIDPGEDLPSRPSRRAVADVPSVQDVRMNAARLLQDTEEIPIEQTNATFPYDADDNRDEEFGDDRYSGSLPSVEEARLYAGRILSAKSTRDLSPESAERARLTDENYKNSLGKNNIPLTDYNGERRKRRIKCFLGASLIVIMGIVIIALAVRVSNPSEATGISSPETSLPSSTPQLSTRMKRTVDFLESNSYSSATSLRDEASPQFKAAEWMSNFDLLNYPIPTQASNQYDISDFVERYVMAVFFFSTGGVDKWTELHNFRSETHVCSWFTELSLSDGENLAIGVSCNVDLRVEELLIPKNGLEGTIPTEMAHLENLRFFDLKDNQLSGSIPDELERWSNMQFFDARRNNMDGLLPAWIGDKWANLELLALADNFFSGTLPPSIAGLRRLKTLALSDNEFRGPIGTLWGITQMEYLYLEGNEFTGKVDSLFALDMENLVQFDVSSNQLTSTSFPVHLFEHSKLEVLDLSDNDMTGSLPNLTKENNVLRYFAIADNVFTGTLPISISYLKGLKHLDLTGNDFDGEIPESLVDMPRLTYLFLSENAFQSGPIPEFMSELIGLRELSLSSCHRDGNIPDWISKMTDLVLLDLSHNKLHGSIPDVVWDLPNLSYLLLQSNELSGDPSAKASKAGNNLDMLLLDKNDLTGDFNEVCDGSLKRENIYVDCSELACTCCSCCKDHEKNCNDNILYSNLDFHWEYDYERVSYAFSPEILFSDSSDIKTRNGA